MVDKSPEDVEKVGTSILVNLYGGREGDDLDRLRYVKYRQKLNNMTFQPSRLPPTSSAAKFHLLRAYYQIQEWKSLGSVNLDPQQWGWELSTNKLLPIMSDKPIAPPELLKTVHCQCKTDCKTARCTCRKHGLVCTIACGECRGESCTNANALESDDA